MKHLTIISALFLAVLFVTSTSFAQNGPGGKGGQQAQLKTNWVDMDGDGICDNVGTDKQGTGGGKGYGLKDGSGSAPRPQDGTGNGRKGQGMRGGNGDGSGLAPQDGTGLGSGNGTGDCDGTGPKGKRGGNNSK